jgi:hypothetical protein
MAQIHTYIRNNYNVMISLLFCYIAYEILDVHPLK